MKRDRSGLVVLLTPLLMSSLVVAGALPSAAMVHPNALDPDLEHDRVPIVNWRGRVLIMRGLDPEEARTGMNLGDWQRPLVVRERDAVRPSPANGRELIERHVVHGPETFVTGQDAEIGPSPQVLKGKPPLPRTWHS